MIVAVLVGCMTELDVDTATHPEDTASPADSSEDTDSGMSGELVPAVEYVGSRVLDEVGGYIVVGQFGLEDRAVAVGTPSGLDAETDTSGVTSGVYLLAAPWSGGTVQSVAVAGAPGLRSEDSFGFSVALPGDMTGDGVPDLAVGAHSARRDGSGGFYVFDGASPVTTVEGLV